ncbi:MAG: DUF4417 domain-containing protein [Rhodospirillales bacterium]|nr:DUF4417 domain-containing protein [Rhodospirillales bacterium]
MLTRQTTDSSQIEARNRRRERKLWEQPRIETSLGCLSCPQFGLCGGLHTIASLFDCMGHCCGSPEGCTKMCRLKAHDFAQKVREIGGFELENVARSPLLAKPNLPPVVPMIFHGDRRQRLFTGQAAALSMHRLLHRATGQPKFESEDELRAEFRLAPETAIVLSGTDQDPPLERWWGYGEEARERAIAAIKSLGVSLVTTPNYSLFANSPRWDDLHSMKRIALVYEEFSRFGLATALHVNSRSDRDNERWTEFVADRSEISCLAYEFTTGSGRVDRRELHAQWLAKLAAKVERPLTIVVRGGIEVLPILAGAFNEVVYIETSAFMKTMKRQRAVLTGNARLKWENLPTPIGAELDDLFEENVQQTSELVRILKAPILAAERVAAE